MTTPKAQRERRKLTVRWSKRERDHVYTGIKTHGMFVHDRFYYARTVTTVLGSREERSFLEELDARGYDLTTLRFSIELKKASEP